MYIEGPKYSEWFPDAFNLPRLELIIILSRRSTFLILNWLDEKNDVFINLSICVSLKVWWLVINLYTETYTGSYPGKEWLYNQQSD